MHGLINRSVETFVRDTAGDDAWASVVDIARLEFEQFESMLFYDDDLIYRVLDAASTTIGKPVEVLLEDLGTYLVTHPRTEPIRLLMRFGGVDYIDFLYSLDDLPDRARFAVPDLTFPEMSLIGDRSSGFRVVCETPPVGIGFVLTGILRAMADDFGVLAILEVPNATVGALHEQVKRTVGTSTARATPSETTETSFEVISIQIHDTEFADGRSFELAEVSG